MNLHICKNLVISLSRKNPILLYKPHYASTINLFFFSTSGPKISEEPTFEPTFDVAKHLINKHQFSSEVALKASSIVTNSKTPENIDSILLYLKESGFSNTHIEYIVQRMPLVLSANLERTIKPKIKLFQVLEFTPSNISDIIAADPWILKRSVDYGLVPSILALKSVLGSTANVAKALKISGWFLKHNLQKSMIPNIEFLKSCGIGSPQLVKFVFNFPRLFMHKPDCIREFVKRVDEIGFDRNSKMFLHAIRALSSMSLENWELKLNVFRSLGFSEDDVWAVFRRAPQVFAISERKIKDVTKILLSSGNYNISYIVHHPELLNCSIQRRIKPRLKVVETLETKKLLNKKPMLTTVCKLTDRQFLNRFVLPFAKELHDVVQLVKLSDEALQTTKYELLVELS